MRLGSVARDKRKVITIPLAHAPLVLSGNCFQNRSSLPLCVSLLTRRTVAPFCSKIVFRTLPRSHTSASSLISMPDICARPCLHGRANLMLISFRAHSSLRAVTLYVQRSLGETLQHLWSSGWGRRARAPCPARPRPAGRPAGSGPRSWAASCSGR